MQTNTVTQEDEFRLSEYLGDLNSRIRVIHDLKQAISEYMLECDEGLSSFDLRCDLHDLLKQLGREERFVEKALKQTDLCLIERHRRKYARFHEWAQLNTTVNKKEGNAI